MTRGYTARLLNCHEYPEWNRLVDNSPEGGPYYSSQYLEVLCRAAGGDFEILGVSEGDELVGGVPLYERSARTGTYLGPRLLLYYNGLVLRDYDTRYPSKVTSRHLGMMEALESGLRERGYAGIQLRCRSPRVDLRPFRKAGWRVDPDYTYVVPLTDLGRLWKRVDQNLRRLVDRARQRGIEFTVDGDFDSFYRLHQIVSAEKGAPLYLPRAKFERYFRKVRDRNLARLFHARLPDGQSVATLLILASDHPVAHTVCAAADPDHYDTGASPYLRWKSFEWLSEAGYGGNDLTDATLNTVSRFKRQLGSDLSLNLVLKRSRPFFKMERSAQSKYWEWRESVASMLRPFMSGHG